MIVSEVMPSPDCHDDPTNQHGTGFLSCRHGCQLGIEGLVSKRLGSRYRSVARLAQVQEPGGAGREAGGGGGLGMTILTMRRTRDHFVVTGPDIEPVTF